MSIESCTNTVFVFCIQQLLPLTVQGFQSTIFGPVKWTFVMYVSQGSRLLPLANNSFPIGEIHNETTVHCVPNLCL